MKKILFGITSLTLGGAERVLVDIANELSLNYDVTIFTIYGKGEFEKELSNNVKLVNMIENAYKDLSPKEKLGISLKLLFGKKILYKKYISKDYDTEIAFLEGPITRLFSIKKKNVKKIAWVHNDITKVFGKNFKAIIKRILDKRYYNKYNKIIFVSNDNKKKFEETYNIKREKIVISNYISSTRVLENSKSKCDLKFNKNNINFLTVARLTPQKALDRLIKVHSKLINDGFFHKFYIIGDGPQKNYLQELINKYNVKETFILLGKKNNPYPYMVQCDIFALVSAFEGLPMTILEAKILGKPILITNTAAREAVEGYEKSIIINNDEDGIYDGIKQCLKTIEIWNLSQNQQVEDNYGIIKQIEKLVE